MNKSTGIFIPDVIGYKKLKDDIKDDSYNGICEHLGYKPNQTYSLYCFEQSKYVGDIETICFEIFSNNIIFITTINDLTTLSSKMINEFIKTDEWTPKDVFDILSDGIEEKNLTIKFLSRVLNFTNLKPNGKYHIKKIGYILEFKDGILASFEPSDGLNRWAKEEKKNSPEYFEQCINYAKIFLKDPIEVLFEINKQAETSCSIPMNKKTSDFVKLHVNNFGTINWYNLSICHYNFKTTIDEFLQINKGRYQELTSFNGIRRIKVDKFVYKFTQDELVETEQININEITNCGYIYAMINQSLKNIIKIGKTRKSPEVRAKELSSTTGVPSPYFVAYKIFVRDCDEAEKYIHNILTEKGYRVSKNREFFSITLDKAVKLMVDVKEIFATGYVVAEDLII